MGESIINAVRVCRPERLHDAVLTTVVRTLESESGRGAGQHPAGYARLTNSRESSDLACTTTSCPADLTVRVARRGVWMIHREERQLIIHPSLYDKTERAQVSVARA